MADSEVLQAPHVLDYPYVRSVGPVLGAFLAGLQEGRLIGVRASGGKVVVPPTEYDPVTGEDTGELVEVGPGGVVTAWGWTEHPTPDQPLDRPFAWALVKPDGADTALLHVVDAPANDVRTGMRVTARFRPEAERVGHVRDIAAFVPEEGGSEERRGEEGRAGPATARPVGAPAGAVPRTLSTPIHIDYSFTAGHAQSRWLKGLTEGRFLGQRCPACGKVYVPPRGSCPTDGVPTTEEVELGNTGTVTTYCVVNVPFAGQQIELPYICAQILLDGANLSFMGLIQEVQPDQVRMGMRVEAVWRDRSEWGPTLANVKHFRPTGEPDAPYETYEEYL